MKILIPLAVIGFAYAVLAQANSKASSGAQSNPRIASDGAQVAPGDATVGKTNAFTVVKSEKGARRARMPHELRRREGAIPGIVTFPFGKTAAGERTHVYRVMGQGGVVADFLDYGAQLYRLYVPDATGALVDVVAGAKPSILAYEKAGEITPVWQMTPIRKPRATGLAFELADGRAQTPAAPHSPANSNNPTTKQSNNSRIVYWLDAQNHLSIESTIADTNAVKWCSTLRLAPIQGGRSLAITTPTNSCTLATTTNVTSVLLRPTTNNAQKVEVRVDRQ